jgi:hypothetical protein
MNAQKENPDPFAGYDPVQCRWLSEEDAGRAGNAEIVRLVVDDNRWAGNWSNEVYQMNTLREIANFLGPIRALVVTPAGMLTIPMADYPKNITGDYRCTESHHWSCSW